MIQQLGTISHTVDDLFLKMWQVQVQPADRILREHRHINFEIAAVLEGEGIYHTAAGSLPMKPGDVFVFSGNEPHCITKSMQHGLTLVNLHFNWQFFSRYCGLSDTYPNIFFAHSRDFCNRISGEDANTLRRLLKRITEEFSSGQSQYESAVGAYVNLMFVELVRHRGYYAPEEEMHLAMDKILQGVQFIDRHFAEDITLEQIAEKSGITPNYFSKLFHQCFQVKLWDYITAKRIDKAKRLLRTEEGTTVLDIAVSCGFHNTANFNRAFLKFAGITPSAYKTHRELMH